MAKTSYDALYETLVSERRARRLSIFDRFLSLLMMSILWLAVGCLLVVGVVFVIVGSHRGRDGMLALGALVLFVWPWFNSKVQKIRL